MSPALAVSIRRANASVSSVVVKPLPHSLAMSRKGALVMAAMGARRQSSAISICPIFMVEPGSSPGYPIYTAGDGGRPSAHRPLGEREGDARACLEPLADLLHLAEEAPLVHEGLPVGVHDDPAVHHDGVHAAAVGVVDQVVDGI